MHNQDKKYEHPYQMNTQMHVDSDIRTFEESSEAALRFLRSSSVEIFWNTKRNRSRMTVRWTRIHHEWSMIETERTLNASTSLSESQTGKNMWVKRLNNTLNGQLSATYYTSFSYRLFVLIAFMISKYLGSEISRRAIFSWASKTLSPRGGKRSRKQILTELHHETLSRYMAIVLYYRL